jgi:hypothetical protein
VHARGEKENPTQQTSSNSLEPLKPLQYSKCGAEDGQRIFCPALIMNSKQVRDSIRVQSPCSPAYGIEPATPGQVQRRRSVPAEKRWAIGLSMPAWGFRIACSHVITGQSLPPGIQERAVRRAYFYLRGANDEMMSVTLSLWQPEMRWTRITLQGLLSARDVTLDDTAHLLELPREVVELFCDLFFPVRTRGVSFMASLAFPQTRLGLVTETETEFAQLELNLMRAGRDYGWQEVARFAGLTSIENDKPMDDQVEDLERLTFGNALMVGRAGGLNRRSEGLHYAKSFVAARRSKAMEKDDDSRRGLAGMSMGMAVNESFMRIMTPDLQRRLEVQRGIETEVAGKPKERPTATRN